VRLVAVGGGLVGVRVDGLRADPAGRLARRLTGLREDAGVARVPVAVAAAVAVPVPGVVAAAVVVV
jgi:hypothetical protein